MWHLHKWEVVDRETHPSAFEQMKLDGLSEFNGVCPWVFNRPVIVTYKCRKCGEMKVVRV